METNENEMRASDAMLDDVMNAEQAGRRAKVDALRNDAKFLGDVRGELTVRDALGRERTIPLSQRAMAVLSVGAGLVQVIGEQGPSAKMLELFGGPRLGGAIDSLLSYGGADLTVESEAPRADYSMKGSDAEFNLLTTLKLAGELGFYTGVAIPNENTLRTIEAKVTNGVPMLLEDFDSLVTIFKKSQDRELPAAA